MLGLNNEVIGTMYCTWLIVNCTIEVYCVLIALPIMI